VKENRDKPAPSKSLYTSPHLETFGPVQGLTLGSGGTMGDGNLGMTRGDMDMNGDRERGMGMGMGMGMN
jgi:hypothetical protein